MNTKNTGWISRFQHFSTGDGPGIRTTVFFLGCNLHCKWCHNPETISGEPQLLYYKQLCTLCANCEKVCPRKAHKISEQDHRFERKLCNACRLCTEYCPRRALQMSGKERSVDDVVFHLLKDREFYDVSGGGVTFSGGEPLVQKDFCAALAEECKKEGLHVIIDTAGNVGYSAFEAVIPYTDQFYFDIKAATEQDYWEWTGGSMEKALSNIQHLIADGCNVVIRIPVIPGYNDHFLYIEKIADRLNSIGIKQVQLLPFHRLGFGKFQALDQPYECASLQPPSKEHMEKLKMIFLKKAFTANVSGE